MICRDFQNGETNERLLSFPCPGVSVSGRGGGHEIDAEPEIDPLVKSDYNDPTVHH